MIIHYFLPVRVFGPTIWVQPDFNYLQIALDIYKFFSAKIQEMNWDFKSPTEIMILNIMSGL